MLLELDQLARGFSPEAEADSKPADGASTKGFSLNAWVQAQGVNVARHLAALRPFRRDEFGTGASSPTEGHIRAANGLIAMLRKSLRRRTKATLAAVQAADRAASATSLQTLMTRKEIAHQKVQAVERIWDFYFELFGQRQSRFGDWLLSCDRIALDCYQYTFMGLGKAKSIPSPAPFSYMRTGFSPATFRRGIPLRRLGRKINPFPLIQLPYHRLVNPWTLGAVLHEVSHNLHNELGLARAVPTAIARRLTREGLGEQVAFIWTRWNRETFADMSGLLLGGPCVVASLMDVVARGRETVYGYTPTGPHPTPYLRVLLSIELLRRMGFSQEADRYRAAWTRIYPDPRQGSFPRALLASASRAIPLVVDAICYQPYSELGNKSLSDVIRFAPKEQQIIEEAAARLAGGVDPGVVPERFLIGATRIALDCKLARPGAITANFYKELARR